MRPEQSIAGGMEMNEQARRLGSRLRGIRQARGLTQEKLAELAGFHPTHIAKIEAGDRLPSLDALVRLAAVVGTSVSELVKALDNEPEENDEVVGEIVTSLKGCNTKDLELIRDLVQVIRRHRG